MSEKGRVRRFGASDPVTATLGGFATVRSATARPESGRSSGGSIWPKAEIRLSEAKHVEADKGTRGRNTICTKLHVEPDLALSAPFRKRGYARESALDGDQRDFPFKTLFQN